MSDRMARVRQSPEKGRLSPAKGKTLKQQFFLKKRKEDKEEEEEKKKKKKKKKEEEEGEEEYKKESDDDDDEEEEESDDDDEEEEAEATLPDFNVNSLRELFKQGALCSTLQSKFCAPGLD
jgi:hypothetical protein